VDESAKRLELARRYIEPYAERAPIAVLGGSVAQGVADAWSDVDTIVYWDAIDRVYVAPDKLKRIGAVVGRMEVAPPAAARRLDALLELPREAVRGELDDLVGATLDLVDQHLPDVDTAKARSLWGRSLG
jgi:predicted nucleotidyltransferase